jgi:hypothetical protein
MIFLKKLKKNIKKKINDCTKIKKINIYTISIIKKYIFKNLSYIYLYNELSHNSI